MTDRPIALITGAAGGMASALAIGFRTAGYDVVAVDLAAAEHVEASMSPTTPPSPPSPPGSGG